MELVVEVLLQYSRVKEMCLAVEWCGGICREAVVNVRAGRFPSGVGSRVDVLVNACGWVVMTHYFHN
jgi:hypothetical protein